MSEEDNSNEEKEEKEENEDDDEEEDNNKEKEDDSQEKENNEENNEENEINIEDNGEEGEKPDDKEEEKNKDNTDIKKDSNLNKFLQSKLKPSSEIKIDLKSNENNFLNKLNISNHSILTAEFTNSPPTHNQIPFIPFNKPFIQVKSNLKIITEINKDMDLLSSKLNKNIFPHKFLGEEFSSFKNNFYENNYNHYDKEDFEIKKLINKVNEFTNTNYTTYNKNSIYNHNANNYNNYIRNSKKLNNQYYHTNNNYNESSYDSKETDNNYNDKYYQTLPNFRNNYQKENKRRYFFKDYNNLNSYHNKHHHSNNYVNTNSENSLYSNDTEKEREHARSRNMHKRNYFINNKIDRAATYNGKNKIRYYLKNNDINNIDNNDYYLKTYNQTRKRPLIYIQPESSHLNYNNKRRYHSSNKKNYILNRDNYTNYKKKFYRFNTENDNRAINILIGNE